MKIVEVVAALTNLTPEQVEAVVAAVEHNRNLQTSLAAAEPRKSKRGRKPGVKNKPKAAPAKEAAKKAAPKGKGKAKSSKALPDSFEE